MTQGSRANAGDRKPAGHHHRIHISAALPITRQAYSHALLGAKTGGHWNPHTHHGAQRAAHLNALRWRGERSVDRELGAERNEAIGSC